MGVVITNDHKMMIMELLPISLYQYLRKNKMDFPTQIRISLEISRGMNYLASLQPPIHHRDLKSLNIMLNGLLQPKLTDFGLSKVKTSTMTSLNQVGTPQWSSPEILSMENDKIDYERSDVYSFGVVLWEIITSEIPWEGLNANQIIVKIVLQNQFLPIPKDVDPSKRYLFL
jgi:sterile alpha motif and leucine zipper-containing kinase AZK